MLVLLISPLLWALSTLGTVPAPEEEQANEHVQGETTHHHIGLGKGYCVGMLRDRGQEERVDDGATVEGYEDREEEAQDERGKEEEKTLDWMHSGGKVGGTNDLYYGHNQSSPPPLHHLPPSV